MIGIVEDTKDRFYALIGNGKCTNQKVVRLYEDGNVEEINIDDIKKVTDGEMPIGISSVFTTNDPVISALLSASGSCIISLTICSFSFFSFICVCVSLSLCFVQLQRIHPIIITKLK